MVLLVPFNAGGLVTDSVAEYAAVLDFVLRFIMGRMYPPEYWGRGERGYLKDQHFKNYLLK